MSEKPVVEILEGGLEYLRTNGWLRHRYGYRNPGDTCQACALGALFAGAGESAGFLLNSPGQSNLRTALSLLEGELPPEAEGNVPDFNDFIAENRREVEQLYARAIQKAKAA